MLRSTDAMTQLAHTFCKAEHFARCHWFCENCVTWLAILEALASVEPTELAFCVRLLLCTVKHVKSQQTKRMLDAPRATELGASIISIIGCRYLSELVARMPCSKAMCSNPYHYTSAGGSFKMQLTK